MAFKRKSTMGSKSLHIALIGYGKMGKIIEQIAMERGHTVSFTVSSANADFSATALRHSDVAIEFSNPASAVANIKKCIEASVPVAIGTTGWYEHLHEIEAYCDEKQGCILPATNFSIGVNIFFEINKRLATLMNGHEQYDPMITEIHHTEKKDTPSGTAITIAEGVLGEVKRKEKWTNAETTAKSDLPIISSRVNSVPGTHEVVYDSPIDKIAIVHEAKNRNGFALGAVLAAEFIYKKTGIFTMKDVLNIG